MGKLSKQAQYLFEKLDAAGLLKEANQTITHKKLEAGQPTIGDKMQQETESGTEGDYASDPSVNASIEGTIEATPPKVEGPDSKPAASVLSSTGTTINDMTPDGQPTGTPASVVNKAAALRQKLQACADAELRKQAYYDQEAELQKQAAYEAEADANFVTATQVMQKVASLATTQDTQELNRLAADIEADFVKLANYNPLFNEACEAIRIQKMAAEIDALASAEGISPEEAAQALEASTEGDPQAQAELDNEVQGEALSALADEEQAQAATMGMLDDAAGILSQELGVDVSPEDVEGALQEVIQQADEMGVAPEELIMAAAEEMMGAQGEDVSEEDMADAEALIEEAAANGVSPEELIEGLSAELGEGAVPAEEAPAEAPAEAPTEAPAEAPAEAPTEDMEKEACLTKLASTRRGQNLLKILSRRG